MSQPEGSAVTTTLAKGGFEPFQVRLVRTCGVVVLTVTGELDMAAGGLAGVLEQLTASGPGPVVVDLSSLAFCDLRGLVCLLDGCATARDRGVEMVLAGLSPLHDRMWQIVFSAERAPVHEPVRYVDVEEAVAALAVPPGCGAGA